MPKIIDTDNQKFAVHEMSIAELRAWWDNVTMPGHECNVPTEYALPGISLDDLALICRCQVKDFEALTYRELEQILAAAREMNPHFFRLRDSLNEACEKVLSLLTEAYSAFATGSEQ